MSSGILSVGASGLTAAYTALQTTGHNIANVSTPGYKRQSVVQTAAEPQFAGAGFMGNGVTVSTISRAFSELATREVNRATSRASEAETQAAYLKRLDSLMGNADTGIGAAIDNLFNSAQSMSAQPSSTGQRQAFLNDARNLATSFSETVDSINLLKDTSVRDLTQSLKNVNELGKQVASLNSRITLALASGQKPNDLMDQRDNMIQGIANEISVTLTPQGDGALNVLVGNGQPLVVGDRFSTLAATTDPNDPSKISMIMITPTGNVQLGSDGSLMGGKVAGLMNVHNRDLADVQAQLGRLAIAIATPMNAQHQAGVDLSGGNGSNLFNIPAATADAFVANTGNAAIGITIADASQLKASDYRLDFDGTNYSTTRLSDGTVQSSTTLPATMDGFSLNAASGAMNAGDSFSLRPVSTRANGITAAFNDPTKVALAQPVAAKATLTNAGSATVQSMSVGTTANANLTQPVTLTFTAAGSFDVAGTGTGNLTGQTYTPGTAINFNGWSLTLFGTPRPGDTITVGANANFAGDNRNALSLAGLGSARIVDGQTPAQNFAATLASVGGQARAANFDSTVQGAIRDDAVAAEQSVTGVNLDEEAANLMRYQQAYQAAAKVIAAAQTVFDTLLNMGR